jgi:hypothetical protein
MKPALTPPTSITTRFGQHSSKVTRRGVDHDPDVEIFGGTGVPMRGKGIAAYDKEADLMRGAALDDLDEVARPELHCHTPG